MRARIAWILAGVTVACAVADTAVTGAWTHLLSEASVGNHGWPLVVAATVGCALMGALIVSRYERHPIGWLLVGIGVAGGLSLLGETYSIWVISHGGAGSESLGHVAGWVSVLLSAPLTFGAMTILFLIVPDGHFPSRRWRWAVWASLLGLLLYEASLFTTSPTTFEIQESAQGLAFVWQLSGLLLLVGGLGASVVGLVLRTRRSRGEARLQLRWIAAAGGMIVIGIVMLITIQLSTGGEQGYLASAPLFTAYLLLPVCVAISVLRHRLFDIELIISRTLMVSIATAFAASGYVVLVVVFGEMVGGRTGSFWPSLLGTALVALAFQPLRRRVVHLANRMAYGSRAAPYEALADLSRRLGESPAPDALLPTVAEAAAGAVGARSVTVRLDVPDGDDLVARWPLRPDGGQAVIPGEVAEVAVLDREERLGSIVVDMPAGRALRPEEPGLLASLADQAAIAFRNAQLSAQLEARVAQLDARTAELARSRSRIIAARDAERARLERAIRREVSPLLEGLAAELDRPRVKSDAVTGPVLGALLADSVAALEALREITRGIFPAQLERSGIVPAVSAHLGRTGRVGALTVADSAAGVRFDRRVEAAAYFCFVEAMSELQAPVAVTLAVDDDRLHLRVTGHGRVDPDLWHLQDRVEPLAGTVTWSPGSDGGTLAVDLPTQPGGRAGVVDVRADGLPQPATAASQPSTSRSGPNADLVT